MIEISADLSVFTSLLTQTKLLQNKRLQFMTYVISCLLLQTGRQLEAEQSYKYALKVRNGFEKPLIIFQNV